MGKNRITTIFEGYVLGDAITPGLPRSKRLTLLLCGLVFGLLAQEAGRLLSGF